nr:hypothetical protein [Kingella oralis]
MSAMYSGNAAMSLSASAGVSQRMRRLGSRYRVILGALSIHSHSFAALFRMARTKAK